MAIRAPIPILVPFLACLACTATPPDPAASAAEHPEEVAVVPLPGLPDGAFSRVHEIADDVYVYEQLVGPGEVVTTLSMFVVTPEGVLVADGQGSPADTQRLIEEVGSVTAEPITHVVICSDHGDHTAGNVAFPAEAVFYAHPTSSATLQARAAAPDRPAAAAPVTVPTAMVADRLELRIGGKAVEILFLGRAHTGGDLVVYLPAEKILFMSEAYFNAVFPGMGTAYPTEWVAMIDAAMAMEVRAYIPGHSVVGSAELLSRQQLAMHRQGVQQVIVEATRLHTAGLTADEAVEAADFGDMEGWADRQLQGSRAVGRVYMELNDEL